MNLGKNQLVSTLIRYRAQTCAQHGDKALEYLNNLKNQPTTLWLTYALIYIPCGFVMNTIGQVFEIAMFAQWWQVLTCYGLYLIPSSMMGRHRSKFDQYLWGLLVLAGLELTGYAFHTSIAFEGNIIDQLLTERNFSLTMTVFFAAIIPAGNTAADAAHPWVCAKLGGATSHKLPSEARA